MLCPKLVMIVAKIGGGCPTPRKTRDLDALLRQFWAQLRRDRVWNLTIPMTYRGQEGEVDGAWCPPDPGPVRQTLRLP
jgi:hypothetical protein